MIPTIDSSQQNLSQTVSRRTRKVIGDPQRRAPRGNYSKPNGTLRISLTSQETANIIVRSIPSYPTIAIWYSQDLRLVSLLIE
jgi:hypothetical protein